MLISNSEHYGAVVNADFDYVTYLESLAGQGLNYARIFTGFYVESPGDWNIEKNTLAPAAGRFIAPWARSNVTGYINGGHKFDLDKWDDAYFTRLKDFISQAGKRNIVVEITLFSSLYRDSGWARSPLNRINNINGTDSINRLKINTLDNGNILSYQKKLVRKIVQELNDFDNILYEIQNEPWADNGLPADTIFIADTTLKDFLRYIEIANPQVAAWHNKITSFIREEESRLKYQHLIAENIANSTYQIQQPDTNISIFNFHAALPDAVYKNYRLNKAVGFDESGFYGSSDEAYRKQAWNFILAGGALFNGLDYSFTVASPEGKDSQNAPGGGSWKLRNHLKVLKEFIDGFDVIHLKPDSSIFQKGRVDGVRALGTYGKQYAVYIDAPGQQSINLSLPANKYSCEWINTENGKIERRIIINHTTGFLTIPVPSYSTDIALKILAVK